MEKSIMLILLCLMLVFCVGCIPEDLERLRGCWVDDQSNSFKIDIYVTDGVREGLAGEKEGKTCGAFPLRELTFSDYTHTVIVIGCDDESGMCTSRTYYFKFKTDSHIEGTVTIVKGFKGKKNGVEVEHHPFTADKTNCND